jgi:spore germination protein
MFIYTVRPGDQLRQLAHAFHVAPESIIAVNGLPNPGHLLTGQSLIIPTASPVIDKKEINVNGYQYFLGPGAVSVINEKGEYLTVLTPFAYTVNEKGELDQIDDAALIEAAFENKTAPMMCIINFSSTVRGQDVVHELLGSGAAVQNLIFNIIAVMKQKGYRGLNIDFEYVPPEDKESYNAFLRLTADKLHEQGFFVSSAVAPKIGPEQTGMLYGGIDYPAHGELMDFVILMTYEWGYRAGPPQAISPLNQIRRVLDYAVSVIPENKLFFGFQIYARDWLLPHVKGQEAETFSCQEALNRAVLHNAEIRYDEIAQSPFFTYRDSQGQMHEVWFEDARSAQAKFETVREYGLAGISYWALGYPFPQNWTLLAENFQIIKSYST